MGDSVETRKTTTLEHQLLIWIKNLMDKMDKNNGILIMKMDKINEKWTKRQMKMEKQF